MAVGTPLTDTTCAEWLDDIVYLFAAIDPVTDLIIFALL